MTERWFLLLGLAGFLLAGCGGNDAPALSLTCSIHPLSTGALLARVTVTNDTTVPERVIVYGPAIVWLRHITPLLTPQPVVVHTRSGALPFSGFLLGTVRAKKSVHLRMRFAPPTGAAYLLVTDHERFAQSTWDPNSHPHCTIGS